MTNNYKITDTEVQQLDDDGVWRTAIPMPWLFFTHDKCADCGKRFVLNRRERYQKHWRQKHDPKGGNG